MPTICGWLSLVALRFSKNRTPGIPLLAPLDGALNVTLGCPLMFNLAMVVLVGVTRLEEHEVPVVAATSLGLVR